MNAIKENDKDIFDIFHMAKLKDWNLYKTIDGRTFAHVAATFNNIEIIRFLKY